MAKSKADEALSKIKYSELIGGGYDDFWRSRKRFRVVKGGRSSKKSSTMGRECVYRIMRYPKSNILVVRQTGNTHETSTYSEIQQAARQMGVYHLWKFTTNPCEATYKPTGQKILFRGFDDPLKLTSIKVPYGVLCWVWFEEAYEIDDEKAFDTLCEGIRGKDIEEAGLWVQFTLTYNPWVSSHWTKERFWDVERADTYRLTTTHWDNEFLTQADHDAIEALDDENSAAYDPERYKVVGLGEYGIPGGAYFPEFRTDIHVIDPFPIPAHWQRFTAKDYGLDMLANLWIAIDEKGCAYVYKELCESNLTISQACWRIRETNNGDDIRIKYAPPDLWSRSQESGKSRADLFREYGESLYKASNNRESGWLAVKEWLQVYETVDEMTGKPYKTAKLKIFRNCTNLIRCIPQLRIDEKKPDIVNDENGTTRHELTHAPDALRYFCVMRQRPSLPLPQEPHPSYWRERMRSQSESDRGGIPESYINMKVSGYR